MQFPIMGAFPYCHNTSAEGCAMRRHRISIICTIILSLFLASNLPAKEGDIKVATKDTSGREIGLYKDDNYTARSPKSHSVPSKIKQVKAISTTSNEINRDGIYIEYEKGIVKDTRTGLEWLAGPDRDTNWNEARSWVQKLNFDGGRWRMPSIDELKTLYKKGADKRNKTPLLKTTGWWIWSSKTLYKSQSVVWCYGFDFGHTGLLDRHDSGTMRVFAVRSKKQTTDDT